MARRSGGTTIVGDKKLNEPISATPDQDARYSAEDETADLATTTRSIFDEEHMLCTMY